VITPSVICIPLSSEMFRPIAVSVPEAVGVAHSITPGNPVARGAPDTDSPASATFRVAGILEVELMSVGA
jgi:hypothetical protein